jgi:hypothetical protein
MRRIAGIIVVPDGKLPAMPVTGVNAIAGSPVSMVIDWLLGTVTLKKPRELVFMGVD